MIKIGIYGGSFDPVHKGHIKLANYMVKALQLDKLFIIPAKLSPFKTQSASFDGARLSMCRLAFTNKKCEVLPLEIERGGISYTYNTVTEIKKLYPNSELYLITGSDQFLKFNCWYNYKDILKEAVLCGVSRTQKADTDLLNSFADSNLRQYGKCLVFGFNPFVISSCEIRDMVSKNEDISKFVPAKIARYIKEKGLYTHNGIQ